MQDDLIHLNEQRFWLLTDRSCCSFMLVNYMSRYTEGEQHTGEWVRSMAEESEHGWKAFYRTYRWVKLRNAVLARDHHACVRCRQRGKYSRANTVHHIVHLKDAPELAITESNLVSLCASCHEEMHPEFRYKPKGFTTPERW